MRRFKWRSGMALVLALAVMNGGCILIPKLKNRDVELAVGGTTVAGFVSSGSVNTLDETSTLDVLAGLNLKQILDGAGIDVSKVKSIKLSGVDYRITVAEAGRQITNGAVTIGREGRGPFPLVSAFNASAADTTGWIAAPINTGGQAVTEINNMLLDILTALKAIPPGNPPAAKTLVTYTLTGDSTPTDVPTEFSWQLKLKFTVIGKVKVRVPT